jgi:hypothetical protein
VLRNSSEPSEDIKLEWRKNKSGIAEAVVL